MSILTLNQEIVDRAVSHLRDTDSALSAVIDRIGPCTLSAETEGSHFNALARAIVYQQLSGKAASTIYGRFLALYGDSLPCPQQVHSTSEESLRTVGFSRGKAAYVKDLAARCLSGDLNIEALANLTDDEIIERVTAVKGIGRWTAQMFLLFRLGRPDVLSELDLGIRKGIQLVYGLDRLPDHSETAAIGLKWSPYRSVASWYLWRSLEL